MPVIIVKARKGVLDTSDKKAKVIEGMAIAFAEAVGNSAYKERATVIIEEVEDANWGRGGKQIGS